MKIEIAAKNADHAINFMRNELKIKGRLLLGWVDVMKTANTGEVRNLYRVRIDASNTVQNNALYIL